MSLLSRAENADQLEESPPWRVGVSMAATWSWGAAIAVAISVMHTQGLGPFLVWALFNGLSIAFFGVFYTKIENVAKWKKLLPFVLLWLFVGYFAIVMNLNTIMAVFGGNMDIPAAGFMGEQTALYATAAIGLFIALFIGKYGLRGSVATDVYQLALQFVGALGILAVGLLNGQTADIVWMVGDQTSFMITAVLGFTFGATASGMQWQRLETLNTPEDKFEATFWGSAIFSLFMLLVAPAAYVYTGSLLQSAFLVIAALAVATSTADSGSAVLQYVSQRIWLPASVGTLLTLTAVASFHVMSEWGLTGIWEFYATVRWRVVLTLLLATLLYTRLPGQQQKAIAELGRRLRLVIPDRVYNDDAEPTPHAEVSSDD